VHAGWKAARPEHWSDWTSTTAPRNYTSMTKNATSEGGALINLGDISKPATVLIEKISDAVGGIAKPWQMVRIARAEVAAETIRAQGRIQISEIEERALQRMVREEGKKQGNIENITAKSLPQLSSDATPENIENDWLSYFFDRCRLISDDDMQSLWGNILAGQANKPGSFSKRTIDFVAMLDKSDAELFSNFCTFVWKVWISDAFPIIEDVQNELFHKAGITFASLSHLANIGLIDFNNMAGFTIQRLAKVVRMRYFGTPINIELPQESDNIIHMGKALLTRVGRELLPICGSVRSEEYFMDTLERWTNRGYFLTSPLPRHITTEQRQELIVRLKPVEKAPVFFNPILASSEAKQFSDEIKDVMRAAGFEVFDVDPGDRIVDSMNKIGTFLWFKDRKNPPQHANVIYETFHRVGITLLGDLQPQFSDPARLVIVVGIQP
jgi:hypothetical protein